MTRNSRQQRTKTNSNQLRIIGGQWRGRKLPFPSIEGLRPTPDRVRETLFNWLNPAVVNARCLDLFSGSGALGLEALSRGASQVDLVDSSGAVSEQLRLNLQRLNAANAEVWHHKAHDWLQAHALPAAYDIIFLDPPFQQNLLAPAIDTIASRQLLSSNSWIYIETARDEALPALPDNWQLHREKTAGQVSYRLFSHHSLEEL